MLYSEYKSKVRPNWLKPWLGEFLSDLESLISEDEIKNYCELKLGELEEKCKEKTRKPNSKAWMAGMAKAVGESRKAIENCLEIELQVRALKHFGLSQEFHEARKKGSEEKAKSQQQNQIIISPEMVGLYQEKIKKMIESKEWKVLAGGLVAATGRRPSEIIKTAVFSQISNFEMEFTGQIKKREDDYVYKIYSLVPSKLIIANLARLRAMPEIKDIVSRAETLQDIDSHCNNRINNLAVNPILGEIIPPPHGKEKLTCSSLRSVYIKIAHYLFCPQNYSESLFIQENLGHASNANIPNYDEFIVADSNGTMRKGIWREKLSEDIEVASEVIMVNRSEYEEMVAELERLKRLERLGNLSPKCEPTPASDPESDPVSEPKSEPDTQGDEYFADMSLEEVRGIKHPSATIWKLRKAVEAVKSFNELQPSKKERYKINTSVLEALTGCFSKNVRDYLASTEGQLQVKEYNDLHGFGYHQNRGKGSKEEIMGILEYIR